MIYATFQLSVEFMYRVMYFSNLHTKSTNIERYLDLKYQGVDLKQLISCDKRATPAISFEIKKIRYTESCLAAGSAMH